MEEKQNEEHSNNNDTNNEDDYGLPKVSYDPVTREQTREPIIMNPKEPQSTSARNTYKKESSWPMIIGIFVILILAGVFIYLFVFDTPEKVETPIVATPPPVEEEVVIPDAEAFENTEKPEWEAPVEPAEPVIGTISTISSRSGKAYIIAGSFIDVDLARDYGNKLAQEGVSTTVIEPYGKVKYYRLAIADYPTVGDAINNVDQYKAKYGDNIWVLKY